MDINFLIFTLSYPLSMWSEVEVGLFKECANMMKYDDFIHTEKMDSKKSMQALDVGKPRIDCHIMAKGLYTAKDAIESPEFEIPDENATTEQILDITGYYLDCLASRLQGYIAYQSTLLSVYIHKDYEFKNPLIEIVSKAFLACFSEIENYANKIIGGSTAIWYECVEMEDLCHKYDIDSIRAQLENANIGNELVDYKNTVKFALDFADFIKNYPNKPVPEITTFVGRSAPLGFTQNIHYRDLSTTAPPLKIQISDHETSLQTIHKTINSIKEIIQIPKYNAISEIIYQTLNWSTSHPDTPMFERIFFFGQIFPSEDHIYGQSIGDFLKSELKNYHTPDQLEAHADFKSLTAHVLQFARQVIRAMLSPTAVVQCTLQAAVARYWVQIASSLVSLEHAASRPRPKTKQPTVEATLKSTLSNWTAGVTSALGLCYFRAFVDSGIAVADDALFLGQLLHATHTQRAAAMQRAREVDAAYAVFVHRGAKSSVVLASADIDRKLAPPSADELTEEALAALGLATFHAARFCLAKGSLVGKEAPFYSRSAAFASRVEPVVRFGLTLMTRAQFDAAMAQPAEFADAKRFFDEARTLAAKAAQVDPTEQRKAFVKSIIVSSMTVMSKDKVRVTYENNVPAFLPA